MQPKDIPSKPAFQLPSAYEIAMIAATMKVGPDDAFCLWWESKILLEKIEAEHDGEIARIAIGRFADDGGSKGWMNIQQLFKHYNFVKRRTIDDAMKSIGVISEKTLFRLYQNFYNKALVGVEVEVKDEDFKSVVKHWREKGLKNLEVEELIEFRKEQNAQRGRQNRLSVTNGKRRKPVK